MPLGTQKFRTGANIYASAGIIDLKCATATTPVTANHTRDAVSGDIIQDPGSFFDTSSGQVGLDSGTYEFRLMSITQVDYSASGDHTNLFFAFGYGNGFGTVVQATPQDPTGSFQLFVRAFDSDSDADDLFFEPQNPFNLSTWNGVGFIYDGSDVFLPKIYTNISGGSGKFTTNCMKSHANLRRSKDTYRYQQRATTYCKSA